MEVEEEGDEEPENFKDRITRDNMSDLFELCKAKCPVKYLSTIVYLSLRSSGVSWANCDVFLRNMGKVVNFLGFRSRNKSNTFITGAFTAETCRKWSQVFLSGDLKEFEGENRGGKHIAEFFDYFPDIEDSAKQFTLEQCSRKSAVFTAIDLANFIDKEFYSITNVVKGELLRATSIFEKLENILF